MLLSDLRYALRVLRKSPLFSLMAIAALALGIGANTAIFSVVNAVLLQPLPYPDADRLVRVCKEYPNGCGTTMSIPKFVAWSRARSFDSIAAHEFASAGVNLVGGERPEQVRAVHVTKDYFRVFGASVALGRSFTVDEDKPGGAKVAVLTHDLWANRLGGDTGIVGRTIRLNDEPFTVIGVLSRGFRVEPFELFLPLQADPNTTNHGHFLLVVGRLAPGASIESARAELHVLAEQFRRRYPQWMDPNESTTVESMQDFDTRGVRPALLILLGAVALVLLIACANVANLLLVRASGRQKEIAIRTAIGASRSEIVVQLLVESLLLAVAGAVAGLFAGVWGAQALIAIAPETLPRIDVLASTSVLERVLDWRMLMFTGATAVTTGILFGLAPALQLIRGEPGAALKDGGDRGSGGGSIARAHGTLVVAEIALAMVLLVGAVLLIRSFAAINTVEPGFDPQNILTLKTSLAGENYATPEALQRLTETITQDLATVPDVEAAAIAVTLPAEDGPEFPFVINGRAMPSNRSFHGSEAWRPVSTDYFRVLRIPLLRGRLLEAQDSAAATPVIVINTALAKKYWPDNDPIGQQITIGGGLGPQFEDRPREVVGIVADVREYGPRRPPIAIMYIPAAQMPEATLRFASGLLPWSWVVRTRTQPERLTAIVQQRFIAAAALPATRVRTMNDVVAASFASQNFNMSMLSTFGGVALLLAAIGIYGLISYGVERETRSIGLRLALGATPHHILRMVVGRGMRLAFIGVAIGIVAALATSHLLTRMLFGVRPMDPASFVLVTVTLTLTALLACYPPARRATRVDPLVAIRGE